jgi:hypothetical protein
MNSSGLPVWNGYTLPMYRSFVLCLPFCVPPNVGMLADWSSDAKVPECVGHFVGNQEWSHHLRWPWLERNTPASVLCARLRQATFSFFHVSLAALSRV